MCLSLGYNGGGLYVTGITVLSRKEEVFTFLDSLYKGTLCSGIVELYLSVSLLIRVIPRVDIPSSIAQELAQQ